MNFTQIQIVLAYYLDKLKVQNPLVYLGIQISIWGLLFAFSTDKVNINETFDMGVIVVLGGLLTGVSPRTSQKASEYTEKSTEFPTIDQSNN